MPSPGGLTFNATEAAAFRAIAAQNFVSGNVLGWFGLSGAWANTLGLADPDAAFVRALAAARATHGKYLTHGRLWRPPRWRTPPSTMWLHDYGYMEHDPQQGCPTAMVLAECWLADDGTTVLAVANHGLAPAVVDVEVDVSPAGSVAGPVVRVTQKIAGRSAAVLPVRPGAEAAAPPPTAGAGDTVAGQHRPA